MDQQRMAYCLEQVQAYRASGEKSEAWALSQGIKLRALASWCSHAERWRAMLSGEAVAPIRRKAAKGFVAAQLPAAGAAVAADTVRVELRAGSARVELHWPLSGTAQLAMLLREVGR